MGNKLGKRRQVVDEKYTRPQGLYPIKDVDYKKLRKLILESKLAPCYSGVDECDSGLLEECPICFLYYPTLNRSRCCSKSICTECFLQLKNPDSIHPTHCPFCKTPNYAVEYRGVKSKEERGLEQIEEQKVIEAKIRMRQEEVQEEEERLHRRQETSFSGVVTQTEAIECSSSVVLEGEAVDASQVSTVTPLSRASQNLQQNQYDVRDMDLEDIMVMEAIWLSIQENERLRDPSYGNMVQELYSSPAAVQQEGPSSASSSPSGGLASAIAALAERQQVSGEQSGNYSATTSNVLRSGRGSRRTKKMKRNRAPKRSSSEFDMQRMNTSSPWDWFDFYHGSEAAEAGTSYVSSNESENGAELLPPPPLRPPPMSPESVYVSGMSDASSNALEGNDQFTYFLPPSPSPPPPYVEDGWSVFAS